MNIKYQTKLKNIARGVRKYMQTEWLPKCGQRDNRDLCGWCGHASVILFQRLKKLGMKPKIISGDGHYFVTCNGFLVDVTASQFGQAKICVRNYSRVKQIIKTRERTLDFWKQRQVYDSICGNLRDIAIEVNDIMRTR